MYKKGALVNLLIFVAFFVSLLCQNGDILSGKKRGGEGHWARFWEKIYVANKENKITMEEKKRKTEKRLTIMFALTFVINIKCVIKIASSKMQKPVQAISSLLKIWIQISVRHDTLVDGAADRLPEIIVMLFA